MVVMHRPAMTPVPSDFRLVRLTARTLPILLLFSIAALALAPRIAFGQKVVLKPADLFQLTNMWIVSLKFSAKDWEAMEPAEPSRGPFAGRGGFGPGMFLAPAFLEQGDANKDAKLSREEFRNLGEKWFASWDKEKRGKLEIDQLREGLTATLFGNNGPPGPPGRGGGPGGPGGRGPGMNLQGAEGKRNGLASAAGVEFKFVHADLELAGKTFTNVAVRYKGNGTWMQSRGSLKHSLKIDLNQFVKGQKFAGLSKLNLHNNVTDASWMNEVLSHRLFRDAGVPAPRTAYARVYVTVPGKYDKEYLGLYSLVEDVDKEFVEANFRIKEGALFKPVTPAPFADLGNDWARYNQTYDPKTALKPEEKQRVIEFCKLLADASDNELAAKIGEYLDLDEFARFMAVTVWLSTLDSILTIGQNYYVYLHPRTHKLQFIPWDLDHSFGQFGLIGSQEERENLSIHHPWRGEIRFLDRLFKVDAFRKLYLARMTEFNQSLFRPERFKAQVDEVARAIRPAVQAEGETKLGRFDKVIAGESVEPAGFGGPGGPGGPGGGPGGQGRGFGGPGFMPRSKPIKEFVVARAKSVSDQLAGKAQGTELGDFGFGGPGGPGRGGPGGGGRGGGGFGPGMFLGPAFLSALDANKDGAVTHDEFSQGFEKWFDRWNRDGILGDEQLREGLNRDLQPEGGPRGG